MLRNFSQEPGIINQYVAELRDVEIQRDSLRFRTNLARIGYVLAVEISKVLPYDSVAVQTPLGKAENQQILREQPVLATILRAGLPMHEGMTQVFDHAEHAFLAEYRRHDKSGTFVDVESGYITSPNMKDRTVIISDPMLATGSSIVRAVQMIREQGEPRKLHIAAAIAAPEGVEKLQQELPDADIWVAAIDDKLTPAKYIYPGLGDAGDLAYGPKLQS